MNILYCLRRAVTQHSESFAFLDGDCKITYREFNENVHRGAAFLRAAGLKPGDRLGVLLLNSPRYMELYFATALAGVVIVPINTRWNADDVAFCLRDSGAKALVLDENIALTFKDAGGPPCPILDYKPAPAEASVHLVEPEAEDLAALFYTSGTTGGPKGVMLTHRNIYVHALMAWLSNYGGAYIHLHALPMFHIGAMGAFYSTTMAGGTHCFIPTFDAEGVLALVEQYRVTSLILVPTMVNMVVNHPAFSRYDLSSLKCVTYGASPMPLSLLEIAMAKFPCPFQQVYGMTESSPLLTVLACGDHDLSSAAVRSAGRPAPGVEIRVVDEMDESVPAGTSGEVIARGATVMKGYWNRPEITAEVLRGGWLHTGDIGRFDADGFLYILDRKKDMIKTGGENVYSPEVEALLVSHPSILEASAIGVPHDKWGETIRAVVVLRPSLEVSAGSLIEWCRERLTHFKCPTSIVFVESLPKNSTGKILKTSLRDLYGSASGASA